MTSIDQLNDSCKTAARLAEKWMLTHLAEKDIVGSNIPDPVTYYKWPLALIARGRENEASRVLFWIKDTCLSEDGDFVSERSGFHREFYSYANLWLVLAAIELHETVLADKLLGFLHEYLNPFTGGLVTNPISAGLRTEDPLSTSFWGMAECSLNNEDRANNSLKYLDSLVHMQPDPEKFRLRTNPVGSLISDCPPDADSKTYVIQIGKKNECYYFFGAMFVFLARYAKAFGMTENITTLANKIVEIINHAGETALSTIWAAKIAPGGMAMYSMTSDKRYLEIVRPVIKAVLSGQTPGGYWLKDDMPWITVSAEQCYWLTKISEVPA